jgi:hypothetical protein
MPKTGANVVEKSHLGIGCEVVLAAIIGVAFIDRLSGPCADVDESGPCHLLAAFDPINARGGDSVYGFEPLMPDSKRPEISCRAAHAM